MTFTFTHAFDEAQEISKDRLGGKGASLALMRSMGLPVPHGFTIATPCSLHYLEHGHSPNGLQDEVREQLARVEQSMGRRLGSDTDPLLLSVRSGAAISMPGMMDTVLNLGLTSATVEAFAAATDRRFAWDSYRRLLESFGEIVLGASGLALQANATTVAGDGEPDVEQLIEIVRRHEATIEEQTGTPIPIDPRDQLRMAIEAVFRSWDTPRARTYRGLHDIPHDLGTAVTVQAMVFGNRDDRSGTGVAFTRNPNTGAHEPYGDFLFRAQGEDVVSGRSSPLPITVLPERLPEVWDELADSMVRLEQRVADMCDIEFTVESGTLWFLQTRRGTRAPEAAVRIAVEMAQEGLIDQAEAIRRVRPKQLDQLSKPHLDPTAPTTILTTGLAASPGVASGAICLDPDRAVDRAAAGEPTILVRVETSPHDLHGMDAAQGILTTRGGLVSHAAVVARDMMKPAVVGADAIDVDAAARCIRVGPRTLHEGEHVTIDGVTGEVVLGEVPMVEPQVSEHQETLLAWARDLLEGDAPSRPSKVLAAAQAALDRSPAGV